MIVREAAAIKQTTLAFRVHRMEAMVAFYAEAFGATFRDVQPGPFISRFAEIGGVTVKFVPIRDAADLRAREAPAHGITTP